MKQHLFKNSFLRGVLCLLLCIVGIGNAWGEEVTVTLQYSDVIGKGTSGGGGRFYHTISPIFFNFSNAYGNDAHIKSYGSSTITFFGATITKIVITATSSTYIRTWSDETDKITVSEEKAIWKGSANSVTLKKHSIKSSENHFYCRHIRKRCQCPNYGTHCHQRDTCKDILLY